MTDTNQDVVYAGFWYRLLATIIDSIIIAIVTVPLSFVIIGNEAFTSTSFISGPGDFLINWVAPSIYVIVFWIYRGATPGKIVLNIRIVDSRTGGPLSMGQSILRYLSYFISMIPLFLGYIWVAFDSRKQGWHDKIAGTVVIMQPRETEGVHFDGN